MIYFLHSTSCQNFVPAFTRGELGPTPTVTSTISQQCCHRRFTPPNGEVAPGEPLLPAGLQPVSGCQNRGERGRHRTGLLGGRVVGFSPSCYSMQFLYCSHKIHKMIKPHVNSKCTVQIMISCHFCPLTGTVFSVRHDAPVARRSGRNSAIPTASRSAKRNVPLISSYSCQLLLPL